MSEDEKVMKNRKKYFAVYRRMNAEQIREYNNSYYLNNKDAIRLRRRKRYQKAKAEKPQKNVGNILSSQ